MEPSKLRLKVGEHEFEAEGEREVVQALFEAWREMISTLPSPPPKKEQPEEGADQPPETPRSSVANGATFNGHDKIFRRDGSVISLSVSPKGETSEADAALLILLGRKHYLNEDLVGGAWLLRGMEQSGIKAGERADRLFGSYLDTEVLKIGKNRAIRYRLSNTGMAKALKVAREVEQIVP